MKKICNLKLQLQTFYITFFESSFLLFCCLALTISSCNQCDDKQEGRNLGGFQQGPYGDFMPANPFSTFRLLKNGKDTIQFVGQGREEWIEEVSRSAGNCPIYYKLLNHRISFLNITEGTNHLVIRYNQYSEATNFDDYIEYKFGAKHYPNTSTIQYGFSVKKENLSVLGIIYKKVGPFLSGKDTIYKTDDIRDCKLPIIRTGNKLAVQSC